MDNETHTLENAGSHRPQLTPISLPEPVQEDILDLFTHIRLAREAERGKDPEQFAINSGREYGARHVIWLLGWHLSIGTRADGTESYALYPVGTRPAGTGTPVGHESAT